eukprot:496998-Amorphochlora_amoeboformis.AAC.1
MKISQTASAMARYPPQQLLSGSCILLLGLRKRSVMASAEGQERVAGGGREREREREEEAWKGKVVLWYDVRGKGRLGRVYLPLSR